MYSNRSFCLGMEGVRKKEFEDLNVVRVKLFY